MPMRARCWAKKLDVVVGTGPQSLYFALGEKCDELLKSAIDKSAEVGEQAVPPVQLRVAVKPLVAFLASLDRRRRSRPRWPRCWARRMAGMVFH